MDGLHRGEYFYGKLEEKTKRVTFVTAMLYLTTGC